MSAHAPKTALLSHTRGVLVDRCYQGVRTSGAPIRSGVRRLFTCACFVSLLFACEREEGPKAHLPPPGTVPDVEATRAVKPGDGVAQKASKSAPEPSSSHSDGMTQVASPLASGGDPAAQPGDDAIPALAPFTGRSEAHRQSVLTPRMPGVITEMLVRDGDVVEVGQTLVVFDTSDFTMHVRAAKAGLRVANAQKSALKTEWKRLKDLAEGGAIPESQFEQIDGQLGVATAGIGQAKMGVTMAQKALKDATVVAPYRGVVISKMASEGEYAAAMPPKRLVMLQEIDPLDVRIGIPEASLNAASLGDCLEVTFPAVDVVRTAPITQVIPAINPMTRTFSVVVSLSNPDHALPPGLFAKARLVEASACPTMPVSGGQVSPIGERTSRAKTNVRATP